MSSLNETTNNNPSSDQYKTMILAGHLLIIFYCFIFILGFVGNFAVIYVGIRKKKYRNVTNCYVINLALADLFFLSLSIPYTTYLGLVNILPFSERICRIYMLLTYVFLLSTCNTLAAMSIDRYFYIILPRSKLQWRTSTSALIICLIIWIGSFILIIFYYIIRGDLNACGLNGDYHFLFCLLTFCFYYALPLFVIVVCYTKLAMHVIQSNRLVSHQITTKDMSNGLNHKQRQVTRMVFIVTLAFAICWLPIHILELLKCADASVLHQLVRIYPKILYTIRAFTHALAYFNSCLNPYLYALLNRNFCLDLIDIIPNCFLCCQRNSTSHASTSVYSNAQHLSPCLLSNEIFSIQNLSNDDEDERFFDEKELQVNNVDASCQVDLLNK